MAKTQRQEKVGETEAGLERVSNRRAGGAEEGPVSQRETWKGLGTWGEEVEEQGSSSCSPLPTHPAGAMAWGWGEAGKAGAG